MSYVMLVAADGEAARAVQSAGCGLACAAGDEEALCRNLVRLADMPAEARAALGKAGRSYFRAHYRRSLLLQRLLACILGGENAE